MIELKVKSTLSQKEIEDNFASIDFFDGLKVGLEEALRYEKGKAKAETFVRKRNLPNVDVCDLRKRLKVSQKKFAFILGVSTRTVESWEAGRTTPSPTAKKLIYLISLDNSIIFKL